MTYSSILRSTCINIHEYPIVGSQCCQPDSAVEQTNSVTFTEASLVRKMALDAKHY